MKPATVRRVLDELRAKFSYPEVPVRSAYALFLKESLAQIKKTGDHCISRQLMKQVADKWRSLAFSEKRDLKKRVERAKLSYAEAVEKWTKMMRAKKLDSIVQQINHLTCRFSMRGRSQQACVAAEMERLKKRYKYPELKRHSPMSLYVQHCRAKAKPEELNRQWLTTVTSRWRFLPDDMRAEFVNKASQLNGMNRLALQQWKADMERQNLKDVVKKIAELQRELKTAARSVDKESMVKVDMTMVEQAADAADKQNSSQTSSSAC